MQQVISIVIEQVVIVDGEQVVRRLDVMPHLRGQLADGRKYQSQK